MKVEEVERVVSELHSKYPEDMLEAIELSEQNKPIHIYFNRIEVLEKVVQKEGRDMKEKYGIKFIVRGNRDIISAIVVGKRIVEVRRKE